MAFKKTKDKTKDRLKKPKEELRAPISPTQMVATGRATGATDRDTSEPPRTPEFSIKAVRA